MRSRGNDERYCDDLVDTDAHEESGAVADGRFVVIEECREHILVSSLREFINVPLGHLCAVFHLRTMGYEHYSRVVVDIGHGSDVFLDDIDDIRTLANRPDVVYDHPFDVIVLVSVIIQSELSRDVTECHLTR